MMDASRLCDMIPRRRSVRRFTKTPVDDATVAQILERCAEATPLYPQIRVHAHLVTREQVRFYLPWKVPQLLAIYSEDSPGYLENAGFLFQQIDLYLQSIGLGSCWLGLGKLRKQQDEPSQIDGMRFVILIAFGHTEAPFLRGDDEQPQRRLLSQICDREDPRLEPARLAPSSTNSQPWYFTHQEDTFHAYRSTTGSLRHKMLGNMNQIDMGIALSHLYLSNPDTFHAFHADAPDLDGYAYTISFTL